VPRAPTSSPRARSAGRPSGRRDTAAALLRAAAVEFARRGFDGARLEDVARGAGIRRPSLLHHFPSKEALYAAMVRRAFEELGAGLTRAFEAPGDFAALVTQAAETYEGFLEEHPDLARVVLRELLDDRGPGRDLLLAEVVPMLDAVEAELRRLGRGRRRSGVPLRAALMQIVSAGLVRVGAGELGAALFGEEAAPARRAARLARALLVKEGA